MGKHWVKALKTISRYALDGAYRTYQPGDWFECRNQELLELLQQQTVLSTTDMIRKTFDGQDAGVLVPKGVEIPDALRRYGMSARNGQATDLPWERTLLWDGHAALTAECAALGLMRLEAEDGEPAWEMAAMLESDTRLARDIGTEAERALTLEMVGDLRLPVYKIGLVWVRRTPAAEEVIQLWRAAVESGADERHAFLRTIYTHRVKLCTLPADWMGQWMRA
jgi:hypothetical protein